MINSFKELLPLVRLGQILVVYIPNTFEYGYWKNYHPKEYKIYRIYSDHILMVNVNHQYEHLMLNEYFMNNYFTVEIPDNDSQNEQDVIGTKHFNNDSPAQHATI